MAGSGVGKSSLLSMIARGTDADDLGPRPGRRAWPRGPRVHRERPRPRGPGPLGRRRRHLRRPAGRAPARGVRRDPHRRVVPRQRPPRRADDGQPDPRRHGPARDRPLRRRAARHPRLPALASSRCCPGCSSAPAPRRDGSITGLYTVLVEGDDMQDPIGDTARSILDGHIVLSRRLATSGHFPSHRRARVDLPGHPRRDHRRAARRRDAHCAGCWPRTATYASSSRSAPTSAAPTPTPTPPLG